MCTESNALNEPEATDSADDRGLWAPRMRGCFWLLLLFLALTQVVRLRKPVLGNYARVLGVRAYLAPLPYDQRFETLRRAWASARRVLPVARCQDMDPESDVSLLRSFDACYVNQSEPLYVITGTTQIPAAALRVGGLSKSTPATGHGGTMFGEGYLEARVFVLTDTADNWTVSVTALHDDPPPVKLEIWLDGQRAGELTFAKGDRTWETLSVRVKIAPGFHHLRVWYVNDYYDSQRGLDRNAYVEHVVIKH